MFSRIPKHEARVDITSLIDVAFLLIIFLSITTTFLKERGLNLELPEAKGEGQQHEALIVDIDAAGKIFFEKHYLDKKNFKQNLERRLKTSSDKTVVIRADTQTQHGAVVAVMSAVKEAGATGLTIATVPEKTGTK